VIISVSDNLFPRYSRLAREVFPDVLFAVEGMSLLKNTKQQAADYATTSDGDNQLLFAVFMAVVLFCIHGLRVFWPKSFEGELSQHDIDCRNSG
jgi:hypothetical protein